MHCERSKTFLDSQDGGLRATLQRNSKAISALGKWEYHRASLSPPTWSEKGMPRLHTVIPLTRSDF